MADAELRVSEMPNGAWSWCYGEPASGVVLHSNSTYATRQAAVNAARRAYPDVSVVDDAETETA